MHSHRDILADILLTIVIFLSVVWVYNYRHDLPSEQQTEQDLSEEKTYPQTEEEYLATFGGPSEEVIEELYGLEDGKLRYLSSTLCGVKLEEPKETLFSIRVYKENKNDNVDLYKDGEFWGEMYDDATHGDQHAGDCVYSLTVPIESKDIDDQFEFYVKCGDRTSDPVTIYTFSEWTEETRKVEKDLCAYANDLVHSYCDDTGYVPYQNVQETVDMLYDGILEYCDANNIQLLEITKSSDSVFFTFKTGFPVIVQIPQADVGASSNAPISIITIEPCVSGENSLVSFEDQASYMDITLGSLAYYQTQYEDENVNVENIVEAFSPNSIIIWHGHGSINDTNGSYLLTGMLATEDIEEKYQEYFINQALVSPEDSSQIFLTYKFIEMYINDLSDSFVYLGACHSEEDTRLADAMVAKGAVVVQGFSDTVYTAYDTAVIDSMSHELCKFDPETERYEDFETALENTVQNCEDNDIDYAKKYKNFKELKDTTAYLMYYGDHSYCVSDYAIDNGNDNQNNGIVDSLKDMLSEKISRLLDSIQSRISEFLQKIVYEFKVFWYGKKAVVNNEVEYA